MDIAIIHRWILDRLGCDSFCVVSACCELKEFDASPNRLGQLYLARKCKATVSIAISSFRAIPAMKRPFFAFERQFDRDHWIDYSPSRLLLRHFCSDLHFAATCLVETSFRKMAAPFSD